MYDYYFLIREQYFLDFITEFVFDGFSLDTTRSMVAMHDVSFQSKITVMYTGAKPVLGSELHDAIFFMQIKLKTGSVPVVVYKH